MKKIYFAVIFLLTAFYSTAQTIDAEQVDQWLLAPTLSAGQASLMLASARGFSFDTAAEAFSFAGEKKWLPPKVTEDAPVAFDEFAFMAAKFFLIRESLMFRIIPIKRYAYRDLVYASIIQGKFDPKSRISGQQALTILARLLERQEQSEEDGPVLDGSIPRNLAR